MPKLPIIDSLRQLWKRSIPYNLLKVGSVLNMREGEIAVVLYKSAEDKMKVFSAFVREGLEDGDLVDYTYPDEESETVRTELEEHGIDVKKYERKGALILRSLTEYHMPRGKFDKERAVKKGLDDRAEAKRKGYKHFRDLEDLGDFSFLKGQWQTYMDYWHDPSWGVSGGVGILYEPFLMELTAVNVGSMSETQVADLLKAFRIGHGRKTLIDLIEWKDAFSKSVGLTHEKVLGRKFLLEFDPTSSYEKIVEYFAKEALANLEPIFIFTPATSTVRKCLVKQPAVKFFLMSSLKSTPESISENEIVLPAKNTALILDSLNKVMETYAEEHVFLVFNNLSELLVSLGFDRIYEFLRYMMDILSSENATTIFLLNPSAHESQVVSGLRNLFSNHLAYGKNGLEVVRTS